MDYAVTDGAYIENGKVKGYFRILRTFRSIDDARRYCINNVPEGTSWSIHAITQKGMIPKGMVWWTSYPKNGKTSFAWGYHGEKGGLWFINKDGTLGKPMPYQTWRVEDGKQVWYNTTHAKKRKAKLPFGL